MIILCCSYSALPQEQRNLNKADLNWLRRVLRTVQGDIRKSYYDEKFHGLDLDARFDEAEQKIEAATGLNYAIADIAGAVSALNDSHTIFVPPPRPYVHDYGWRMQAEGDSDCFITAVRRGSDAEKKGIRPGDQLLSVNGYVAVREDVWKINYVFRILRPQAGLRIVLRSSDGVERQLDVMADLRQRTKDPWQQMDQYERLVRSHRPRTAEYGARAIFYSLPDFVFDPDTAHQMLDKIRLHDALVLDLRGNPGGYEDFLSCFLGGMFEHDIKIANRIGRKSRSALVAKSRAGKTFNGKLIVLVDSESGSAAELFARVVQLEKRGIVVGDRSSGKVMESKFHPNQIETMGGVFRFGEFITESDLIMVDGKSLENVGVVPDQRIVPTPSDLTANRDPVLADAAGQVGVNISPEEAGKLFPIEWSSE